MVLASVELIPPKQSAYFRKQGPVEAIPFYGAVLFQEGSAIGMQTEWIEIKVPNQLIIQPSSFAAIANNKAFLHAAPGCRIRFTIIKTVGQIPNNAPFEIVTG